MLENEFLAEEKIREFLSEDIGFGDITANSIIDEGLQTSARILCREKCVAAGLKEAAKLFELLGCETRIMVGEGSQVKANEPLMQIKGYANKILSGERTALNLIARMSGIATLTRRAITEAEKTNPKIKVASTRKTAPGLRYFDKRSVELGGGDTHRLGLDDCILIKDNHIKIIGSVSLAVKKARKKASFTKKIEVEVENLSQLVEAIEAGADIVMLDNMNPEEISSTITEIEKKGLRNSVLIEASGDVTEENIQEYVRTGVDIISLGILTHSVKTINVSLEIADG